MTMSASATLKRCMAHTPTNIRRRLEAIVERALAALDELDAPTEDLEDEDDDEPDVAEASLGATEDLDQEAAWGNTFSDMDAELDEAELSGIGDADGLAEQTCNSAAGFQ